MSQPVFPPKSNLEVSEAEKQFSIADFEYELPEELIAQEPLPVRHDSRLLCLSRADGGLSHHYFRDLPEILLPGDVLVTNDTAVTPSRLYARRKTGGLVEILLLRPQTDRPGCWQALATPLRKLCPGERLKVESQPERWIQVENIVTAPDGQRRLLLNLGSSEEVYCLLSESGFAPLPPYIKRDTGAQQRKEDLSRYQTVFARAPGAVAAPTAGLHFSQPLLEQLRRRGVEICSLTLHVGPGTFKPVTTSIEEHTIEEEELYIGQDTADTINRALAQRRRVIAVGTTSCRALETAGASGRLQAVSGARTGLYIKPGYQFRIVSGLMTNFHLSRSSLLILVSAFGGYSLIRKSYQEAIAERYRFYSYGDAMLIL